MQITSISIQPHPETDIHVKATAEVVLNASLTLRGIKIMRGRYGLFLAFPAFSGTSPHRVFETLSMRFRKELQTRVLGEYRSVLAKPLSLFG